jgi:hypothetical protein
MLAGLDASLSMIEVNLLLPTAGGSANSFMILDLMRLPLGVLTGFGFIGVASFFGERRSFSGDDGCHAMAYHRHRIVPRGGPDWLGARGDLHRFCRLGR